MRGVSELGRREEEGRIRRMSQWMFWARREDVERVEGRIIQRIMRERIRGFMGVEERVRRKSWRGVWGVRERRWIVRRGIFGGYADMEL
jgi:hypothetical protein